jgi:hypothetical protein
MSLIFDRFPNPQQARLFVAAVRTRFALDGQVFTDPDEALEHDPFPWQLDGVIVHIDRPVFPEIDAEVEVENIIEQMGADFGGTFVGT